MKRKIKVLQKNESKNIKRVLGTCQDKTEQDLGLTEVKNTISRIKYIREMEDKIKTNLRF